MGGGGARSRGSCAADCEARKGRGGADQGIGKGSAVGGIGGGRVDLEASTMDEECFGGGLVSMDHINGDLEVTTVSGELLAGGRVGVGRVNGGLG